MIFSRSAFVLLLVFTVSLCQSDGDKKYTNATETTPTSTAALHNTTVDPITTTADPITTTADPITTPKPSPAPVDKSEWVVTGINKTVCIVAKMNVTVKVPYTTVDNQTVVKQFEVNPYNTNSTVGNCTVSNITQVLNVMGDNITVIFSFVKNTTENNYKLGTIQVMLIVNNFTFPNSKWKENLILVHSKAEFTTPTKKSYVCSNPDPLMLNSMQNSTASLILSNVHIEAFGTKNDRSFSEAIDCNTYETPDIVPIAVGCALAALVIVVLISYLVGRRRSQARGYLSM